MSLETPSDQQHHLAQMLEAIQCYAWFLQQSRNKVTWPMDGEWLADHRIEVVLLLGAQTKRCHLIDLVAKCSAETVRKSMLTTINKRVARMGIREAFDHGVLHRDLVEVIIQQRCQHEIPSLK